MYSLRSRSRTRRNATAGQSTDDDNASAEQDPDTARGESARGVKRQKNKDDSVDDSRKRAKKIKQDVYTKESQNNANETKEVINIKKSESFDKGNKTIKGKAVKESKNIDKGNEAKEDIKKSESFDKENKTKKCKAVKESKNSDKANEAKEDQGVKKNENIDKAREAKEDKAIKKSESFDKEKKTKKGRIMKESETIENANEATEGKDIKKSENLENKTKEDKDVKKIQNNNKGNSSKGSDNLGKTTKQDMKEKKQENVKHVKKCQKDDRGSSSKESSKEYITKMPKEVLLKIFSTLSMEDLLNVQLVSPELKVVAQDGSLWKDFKVQMHLTNLPNLEKMPGLRNIEGYTTNSAIKTILDNIVDLRSLNCIFHPDITECQMKKVVNKYKKIQSIAVNMCAPSALGCLKVLKCSKSLQMIKLYFCNGHGYFGSKDRKCSNLPKLSSMFAEIDDFPSLEKVEIQPDDFSSLENVEIKPFSQDGHILYDRKILSCLSDILENKSQQLKYLNISFSFDVDASVLGAINKCTKLQELKIGVFPNRSFVEYGINGLTELKSLEMSVVDGDSDCTTLITKLSESLYQGSWSNVTHAMFMFHCGYWDYNETWNFDVPMLKSIIDNMKALKTLFFESGKTIMDENQLSNIGGLESLESLSLHGVKVSAIGLSYFSGCHNLKTLILKTNYRPPGNRRIAEMLQPMENLNTFYFFRRSRDIFLDSKSQIREWVTSVLKVRK